METCTFRILLAFQKRKKNNNAAKNEKIDRIFNKKKTLLWRVTFYREIYEKILQAEIGWGGVTAYKEIVCAFTVLSINK